VTVAEDWVRVLVVLDKRRGTVHGITCDQDEAQRWTRALIAKAGGDNLAATMTVGLVTPTGKTEERTDEEAAK
jgi:hypothetical protein